MKFFGANIGKGGWFSESARHSLARKKIKTGKKKKKPIKTLTRKEAFHKYSKENPYQVWAYREDGSKFVAQFKNKKEAKRWAKITKTILGKTTTASKSHTGKKIRRGLFN